MAGNESVKYLKNMVTGVVFVATKQLVEERMSLNLAFVGEAEYKAQEAGEAPKPEMTITGEAIENLEEGNDQPAHDSNKLTVLVEAIAGLDENNPDHFSRDGVPHATALRDVTGFRVSKDERDAAWTEYQAEQA